MTFTDEQARERGARLFNEKKVSPDEVSWDAIIEAGRALLTLEAERDGQRRLAAIAEGQRDGALEAVATLEARVKALSDKLRELGHDC